MNFQFNYKGTPLDKTEAAALLSVAHGDEPLSVDLGRLIDNRKLSSKTLFDRAVREAKPELASLAWKISVGKDVTAVTDRQNPLTKKSFPQPKSSLSLSQDQVIDKILSSKSYWAAGAALLISNLEMTSWMTLRQLATAFVNHCFDFTLVSTDSTLYKGFKQAADGSYEPVDLVKGTDRRNSYHVSPLYIGLRDGLTFCQKQGLVETKSSIATGFSTGEPSSAVVPGALSRVFYKLRLSETGFELKNVWEDAEDHAVSIFASRNM